MCFEFKLLPVIFLLLDCTFTWKSVWPQLLSCWGSPLFSSYGMLSPKLPIFLGNKSRENLYLWVTLTRWDSCFCTFSASSKFQPDSATLSSSSYNSADLLWQWCVLILGVPTLTAPDLFVARWMPTHAVSPDLLKAIPKKKYSPTHTHKTRNTSHI